MINLTGFNVMVQEEVSNHSTTHSQARAQRRTGWTGPQLCCSQGPHQRGTRGPRQMRTNSICFPPSWPCLNYCHAARHESQTVETRGTIAAPWYGSCTAQARAPATNPHHRGNYFSLVWACIYWDSSSWHAASCRATSKENKWAVCHAQRLIKQLLSISASSASKNLQQVLGHIDL